MVTTRLHTAEDLQSIATKEDDFELIQGELVPMPPPNFSHADLQANVLYALKSHVRTHDMGRMVGEAGFTLQRNPDTVLAPDVSYVAKERLPKKTTGFVELSPDLVVEIISPGNTPGEIERKVAIYLQSGVRLVWVVYPVERMVVAHRPSHPPGVHTEAEEIDGGDVLPDLTLPVAAIFA